MIPNDTIHPRLNGLVLSGGRSQRMGRAKEAIKWHGKQQRYHLADLLHAYCEKVYISCRAEQMPEMMADAAVCSYELLPDNYSDIGPMGGILTAFDAHPEQAWLVIACDLPLVDHAAIAYLVQQRDPSQIATAFTEPGSQFPEPLFAIWEPASYPLLQQMVAADKLSPRQLLMQQQVTGIAAPDEKVLTNVNTPAEASRVKAIIANQIQGR
ncbi:MAG: hypothetical protein K0R59_304 [Sphingobacterium sp.]|jgi:molybdopterin-guanine dinucleotide biosynthesis protein A|uniref:NTP transferase domain-containing protein n=1 Tax=Sphingobacterium sp. NGMCC 1.201703 TaxID=3388657 RepID=UPI002A6223CD|nr:hypothetical protein [Sphingobacterium sp.]